MHHNGRPSDPPDPRPGPLAGLGARFDLEDLGAMHDRPGSSGGAVDTACLRDDGARGDLKARPQTVPWRHIVDALRFGVLVVDDDWQALELNLAAAALLGADRALVVAQGRIVFRSQKAQERAVSWLRGTGNGQGSPLAIERASGGSPFLFDHLLTVAGAAGEAMHVLVLLDPGQPPRVDADRLAAAFGLTRAEARLMAALAEGHTLQTFAQRHEVGVATARTHLVGICAKTGARRQTQVVRLALACAAPVAGHRDGDQPALRPGDGRSYGLRVPGGAGGAAASIECRSRST